VGDVNGDMRLAMGLSSGVAQAAAASSVQKTQWFAVMGNPALRSVFETALGLPSSFGAIDIDQQVSTFQDRAKATFGTASLSRIAADADLQDKVIRLFLVRSDAQSSGGFSSARAALALLGGG
jgi:hypothetical protein